MKMRMLIYLKMAAILLSVSCTHIIRPVSGQIQEQRLGPMSENRLHERITFSGRHIAWITRRGPKECVAVDGQEEPEYDEIHIAQLYGGWGKQWLDYSLSGEHRAYWARRGNNWHPVIDGDEGPAYDEVGSIEFGPSSRRVVYKAKKDGKSFMVVDGVPSSGYDSVGEPKFSSKGKHLAYVATKDGRQCLVLDGKEGSLYDEVLYRIAFSLDEEHVAYVGCNGAGWVNRKCVAIVDGEEGPAYNSISGLEFSPDGEHVAYRAMRGKVSFMVVDNKEGPGYKGAASPRRGPTSPFSPQGNRTAYRAQRTNDKWLVVVDGKEGPEYDDIMNFTFSPNGQHFGYQAKRMERNAWL